MTVAAAAAWDLPTAGVLTLDYLSHTTRVTRDALTMLPTAFEELLARLARATRLDAAGAAAAAVDVAVGAPVEGGVMVGRCRLKLVGTRVETAWCQLLKPKCEKPPGVSS